VLLKAFASRLTKVVRATDTVARLGGDEFAVILEGQHGPDDAVAVVEKILGAMREPVNLGPTRLVVTTSIGVATWRRGGCNEARLRERADAALYRTKAAGRNGYTLDVEPPSHLRLIAS
jgi:diguanylate cyclase (GGDEF)-like protein